MSSAGNTTKPKLLVAESNDFCKTALEILERGFDVHLADLKREQLLQNVHDVDVMWVRLRTRIDQEVLNAARRLKIIATNTTGLTHIDLDAAWNSGVEVVSLRGETDFLADIRATAEHTIALALALLRRIPAAFDHVLEGGWDRDLFEGREIYRSTVGVVGFGRLGKIVGSYFYGMGAQVLICDPNEEIKQRHYQKVELDELLERSDIVTLHADYRGANEKIIGRQSFERMKSGALFINTARGELVDEEALLGALQEKTLAGAALDVISSEQAPGATLRRLRRFARQSERLILTPHLGGNTLESRKRTEIFLATKLIDRMGLREMGDGDQNWRQSGWHENGNGTLEQ